MLAKAPTSRPSLDEVERALRVARGLLAPAPRASGSLLAAAWRMPREVLGAPALQAPPLTATWAWLAAGVVGLSALVHALP